GRDEIPVAVWVQRPQRRAPGGGRAGELSKVTPPMRQNCRVGVQRKAVDTGAARPRELGRLPLVAKPGADAPDVLPGPVPEGDALLHRGRHGAGELWCRVTQGVIPGGHGGLQARLQIPQPTQLPRTFRTPLEPLDYILVIF